MLGKILSLFASVILLVGCSSNAPDIRAICLRDDIGNYVIKWETDPVMEGIVKMTVSDNPDLFTNESPIIYANIKDGVATYITNDNISRKYFRLSFNDKYPRIIGARSAVMDSVQNFREWRSTSGILPFLSEHAAEIMLQRVRAITCRYFLTGSPIM